jgi:hypothetical protein
MVTDTADATDAVLVTIRRDELAQLFTRVGAQEISPDEALAVVGV